MVKVRALFFRENSPPLSLVDKEIIDVLVRGPQTAGGLIKKLKNKVPRRTAYNHIDILEKSGIVKKKGDYYHCGPIVELEARNTLLGAISFVALLFSIFAGNVALFIFSILCLTFAANRKIRYEKTPVEAKIPQEASRGKRKQLVPTSAHK